MYTRRARTRGTHSAGYDLRPGALRKQLKMLNMRSSPPEPSESDHTGKSLEDRLWFAAASRLQHILDSSKLTSSTPLGSQNKHKNTALSDKSSRAASKMPTP